eukprot:6489117-Amphidinium_carterae.1
MMQSQAGQTSQSNADHKRDVADHKTATGRQIRSRTYLGQEWAPDQIWGKQHAFFHRKQTNHNMTAHLVKKQFLLCKIHA